MATKEEFLNRIANRMGRNRIRPDEPVPKPAFLKHPWDHVFAGATQQELVHAYQASLEALGGEVIPVANEKVLTHQLQTWVTEHRLKNIVAWKETSVYGQALLQAVESLPADQHNCTIWDENGDPDVLLESAEKADVGFTIARHGLAETGTTVLYNRGDCGRLVSLMPTICAMILPASTIVPRLTQLLPNLARHHQDFSCFNLITGPSRSADIEMSLSIGVHGPGKITVFLVNDLP